MPLSRRCSVLAFQLPEQCKIGWLVFFRQPQFIPRKVVPMDDFSLDRPLDIGKRVFRIPVTGEFASRYADARALQVNTHSLCCANTFSSVTAKKAWPKTVG
jgi:hypothetical protein